MSVIVRVILTDALTGSLKDTDLSGGQTNARERWDGFYRSECSPSPV